MLLNKGTYGGKRYFKPETVDLFTAYGSKLSHRGLGFDKALPKEDDGGGAGESEWPDGICQRMRGDAGLG